MPLLPFTGRVVHGEIADKLLDGGILPRLQVGLVHQDQTLGSGGHLQLVKLVERERRHLAPPGAFLDDARLQELSHKPFGLHGLPGAGHRVVTERHVGDLHGQCVLGLLLGLGLLGLHTPTCKLLGLRECPSPLLGEERQPHKVSLHLRHGPRQRKQSQQIQQLVRLRAFAKMWAKPAPQLLEQGGHLSNDVVVQRALHAVEVLVGEAKCPTDARGHLLEDGGSRLRNEDPARIVGARRRGPSSTSLMPVVSTTRNPGRGGSSPRRSHGTKARTGASQNRHITGHP
mmetsp:Transcript_14934/g.39426  ORF Transcript_14934/g.39426 Transcript_14934/m.39426 type:complete len:286 (-) Transcript_14934:14-871(-)